MRYHKIFLRIDKTFPYIIPSRKLFLLLLFLEKQCYASVTTSTAIRCAASLGTTTCFHFFKTLSIILFRTQTVESARAEAERVRLIGASEARAIEAVGRAEAEKMRMKASAYKQYGDAAIMALVLEALPQIAAEVAAPLAKTDEIVLLGGADKTTTEVNKLLGQLPPAVAALTGVDVTGALGKIPGATMKAA